MSGYLQDMHTLSRDALHLGTHFYRSGKEGHMARSSRDDAQRQSALLVEEGRSDLTELPVPDGGGIGESGAALDTLSLGHAGLRNECWSGVSGMELGSRRRQTAAPRLAALRLRRAPRCRTPLHSVRPSQAAEARYTPDDPEFLTY